MAMTVTMPQLGESVTEGTIARWLKQPGELVSKYESIAEVVTDKVNAEIPAPAEGSMGEHIAKEGQVVAVGEPICTIETAEQGQANSAWHQGDGEAQTPAEAGASQPAADDAAQAQPAAQPEAQPVAAGAQTEQGSAQPAAQAQAAAGDAQSQAAPPAATEATAPPAAPDAAPSAAPESAAQPAPAAAPATGQEHRGSGNGSGNGSGSASGEYHLTPAVRMLVRENDVDLSQVQGSGLGGRISKKDVLDYVQQRDAGGGVARPAPQEPPAPAQPSAAAPAPGAAPASSAQPSAAASAPAAASAAPATAPAAPAPVPAAQAQPQAGGGDEVTPLTPTRRAIAEHMVRSKRTSPHAWMSMEVDMSRVAALRASRRADFEQHYGAKLTYLPFVARAVCEALRQYPTLNSSFTDEGIILRHDIHLGIAVALEDNLIVPVVRNADRLSIAGLATTMQDLGDRARANKLKLDEIQGGTFTLNNTGALGTVHTVAIINQPQAAILAMDAVVKRAVVVDDAIAIRPMMNLGLSFDHRINDGLSATRFTKTVKEILEEIDVNAALL
jgi:pyruvate/2-oxoglutarate dehydrogenase complex dihydrolipoamide acyltransferase (E2) component